MVFILKLVFILTLIQTPAAISAEKKFKENIGKKKKRKMPAARKHEDECYRCGEGGELLMCDRKNCTKSFHLFCLKLDKPPHGRYAPSPNKHFIFQK